ncbi:MAG: hypothetical protein QM756_29250 [Polyangiaceae bacterium]
MKQLQLLPLVLLLAACGGPLKYSVASTPNAPGADAELVADVRAPQNQTELSLEVTNLAPPDRVAAGTAHYVAWFRKSDESPWSRIGGLNYDAEDRRGKFVGSVPEQRFDFQVTAEKSAGPASPSSDVVLAQHVAK